MKRGTVHLSEEQFIQICRKRLPNVFHGQALKEAQQVLDNLLLPPVPPPKPKKKELTAAALLVRLLIFIAIIIAVTGGRFH